MNSLETGAKAPRVNLVRTGPPGGDPVILVHPVGLDLTYWSAQIDALSAHHDVIAFDLPGHGRTPGAPQDWTLDKAAELLAQVAQSTGSDRVRLVGLSVGGIIAQQLAITRPELVSALVLIDTAAAFSDEGRASMRKRAAAVRQGGMAAVLDSTLERWSMPKTMARRPDFVERVTRTLLADDAAIHGAMWDMISAIDLVPQLHRVDCPTLVVVGEHDPSSPPAAARVLRDHIRGARLHIVDGASHMAPLERPVIVNELLLEFLSLGASSRADA